MCQVDDWDLAGGQQCCRDLVFPRLRAFRARTPIHVDRFDFLSDRAISWNCYYVCRRWLIRPCSCRSQSAVIDRTRTDYVLRRARRWRYRNKDSRLRSLIEASLFIQVINTWEYCDRDRRRNADDEDRERGRISCRRRTADWRAQTDRVTILQKGFATQQQRLLSISISIYTTHSLDGLSGRVVAG